MSENLFKAYFFSKFTHSIDFLEQICYNLYVYVK